MSKGENLGEFELTVMLVLARLPAPVSARRVYQEIVQLTGRDTAVAATHVALNRLHAKGLVDSDFAPEEPGGRPIKQFALEPAGRDALRAAHEYWSRLWEGAPLLDEADR